MLTPLRVTVCLLSLALMETCTLCLTEYLLVAEIIYATDNTMKCRHLVSSECASGDSMELRPRSQLHQLHVLEHEHQHSQHGIDLTLRAQTVTRRLDRAACWTVQRALVNPSLTKTQDDEEAASNTAMEMAPDLSPTR
jgi:hypothetical protein